MHAELLMAAALHVRAEPAEVTCSLGQHALVSLHLFASVRVQAAWRRPSQLQHL